MLSRDIVWLGKKYGEHQSIPEEDQISLPQFVYEVQDRNEVEMTEQTPHREVRLLESDGLETREGRTRAQTVQLSQQHGDEFELEHVELAFFGESDEVKVPQNFTQAWFHPIMSKRKRWRESISEELESMMEKNVWDIIDTHQVPVGKRIIGTMWVFNIKQNDRYRSRLVALGYRQIPGVDIFEIHAPVI